MSNYLTNMGSELFGTMSIKEELAKKEYMQQKHYFMLNELQNMARELPMKFQQRLPYDLFSSLAHSLLDGTVFEIVKGLEEIQQMTERNLFNQRMKLINTHKEMRLQLTRKHRESLQNCQSRPHHLPVVKAANEREKDSQEKRNEEEARKLDVKIIFELDQTVSDQQVTLEKAGVPGFCVTNNPLEVRLQMYLLDFILKLNKMEMPSQ